jgi:hypothetical protein
MAKRGRIMRDPNAGPGLVIIEGRQYPFSLEGIWRSDTLPRLGLVVDVDFDPEGQVAAMTAVPDAQLAREQAEAALQGARRKGAQLASGAVERFGAARLLAVGLLVPGWWMLGTVTLDAAMFGQIKLTFWRLLGFLNAGNPLEQFAAVGSAGPSTGLYGFAALLCLGGPFLAHFWTDRRAHLAGGLPLAFMVVVALVAWAGVRELEGVGREAMAGAGAEYGAMVDEMQRAARREVMQALSFGAGLWLSLAASIYLALRGARDYLVDRASESAVHSGADT